MALRSSETHQHRGRTAGALTDSAGRAAGLQAEASREWRYRTAQIRLRQVDLSRSCRLIFCYYS